MAPQPIWSVRSSQRRKFAEYSPVNKPCAVLQLHKSIGRDQNGFRPKSLKACDAALSSVCTIACLLNEPQMHDLLLQGGLGDPPPEIFWLLGSKIVTSSAILGHCTQIALPPPLQTNFLLRFTLISRMVPGVWKRSEIRLKSENFDPW